MYRAEWHASDNGQSLISNSWGFKARLQVIITFPFSLMNINHPLFCCQSWADTGGMVSITGLAPSSYNTQQYTPLSCVQSWNLHIGLVLDQILKANFKINEKLWNNAHKSCNKTIPIKIVHYSAMYCVNLSRITLRLFELFTIKSVNFFEHQVLTLKVKCMNTRCNVYKKNRCKVC